MTVILEILRHAGNISWTNGRNIKAIIRSPNNPRFWWAEVQFILLLCSLIDTLPVNMKIMLNLVFISDSTWTSFSKPVYSHAGLLLKFCEVNVSPCVNTWVLACHCKHCASWSLRLNTARKKLLPRSHQNFAQLWNQLKSCLKNFGHRFRFLNVNVSSF